MAEHDPKRPAPGPLPPPPLPPPMRSEQPTVGMGGNVNAPLGALPPPPRLPAHLAPKTTPATRVPAEYAAMYRASQRNASTVTTPRAIVPGARNEHLARFQRALSFAWVRTRAWARASIARVKPAMAGAGSWLALRTRAARVALAPWFARALPLARKQWGAARAWLEPRTRAARARLHPFVRRVHGWLERDRRRWALPGGAILALLGGVTWCSVSGPREPDGVSPRVTRVGVVLTATPPRDPVTDVARAADADPASALPALPGGGDARFIVRQNTSRNSCDQALGRPFRPEAEQDRAKANEMWTRSRKSLMLGNEERALKEMCLSASWDINGRGTYGLSEYFFRASDFRQALRWAERVPEASRRHLDALAMVGDVHSQLGDVDGARAAYTKGWKLPANDQETLREVAGGFTQSADSAMRKKDWWTAERFYRRALTLDPERAEAAAGFARVLLRFELGKPAEVWALRALELDDRSSVAALALCEARIATRDAVGARAALDKLRRMAPRDPAVEQLAQRVEAM